MIPGWKIARELKRLWVQIQAIPLAVYEPVLQRRYDASRHQKLAITKGALPATDKMCIFLIFQPKMLAPSVLSTCRHLQANGFAPLVISNGPLSESSRQELSKHAHLVVERPNFGYDFGGFRDGVWVLDQHGNAPEKVLFLNDSVWFPVSENCGFLEDMEGRAADFVGVQLAGDPGQKGRRRGFFTSYCFLVKRPLLETNAYRDFWAGYRLSSNKEVTLRRGERAFSHAMFDACQAYEAVFDLGVFDQMLDQLELSELWQALDDLVVTGPDLIEARACLLARQREDVPSEEIRSLIRKATRKKNYIGAAPVLCLDRLGFPMIKKNKERLYLLARFRILQAAEEGQLPELSSEVVAEIKEAVSRDAKSI